jgi:hypothetical protein
VGGREWITGFVGFGPNNSKILVPREKETKMKFRMSGKSLLAAGLGAALALSGSVAFAKAHDMGVADGTRGFGGTDCEFDCSQSSPSDPKDSLYGLFTGDLPPGAVAGVVTGVEPNFGLGRASLKKGDNAVVPCGANSKKC